MLRIHQVALPIDTDFSIISELVARVTGLSPAETGTAQLWRRSVDARHGALKYVCSFVLTAPSPEVEAKWLEQLTQRGLRAEPFEPPVWSIPSAAPSVRGIRIAVIGAGPAGLFCALGLARAGLSPDLYERGDSVEARTAAVRRFWETGALDTSSNMLFGEGGAGAFSDGKLRTGIRDVRCRYALETMVVLGAPDDILYEENPHLGTDGLQTLLPRLRAELERLGGRVFFRHHMTELRPVLPQGAVLTLERPDGTLDEAVYDAVVLAVGHSARDTFDMLYAQGLNMTQKPFAIGLRIEHLQDDIDRGRYRLQGRSRPSVLPPAEYALSVPVTGGGKVFTFCMCPGGEIVATPSSHGLLCVNGMSFRTRSGENANAALLAGVGPADFGDTHPLAGVRFQEQWERAAFALAAENGDNPRWRIPMQTVGSFLGTGPNEIGRVKPSCRNGTRLTELASALPDRVVQSLQEAIPKLGRMLPGFDHPETLLAGVETRSSSPVRVTRDEQSLQALPGLYPCGEGAGYAGGILSAAADGLRVAERLLSN